MINIGIPSMILILLAYLVLGSGRFSEIRHMGTKVLCMYKDF